MAIQQQPLREGYDTPSAAPVTSQEPSSHRPTLQSIGRLGPLVLPIVWLAAWILALAGVQASGYHASQGFSVNALRWMFYLPAGWMFIVSGLMHTKYAEKTAALIGWKTNGFQYELGFVSFGLGGAGIYASLHGVESWVTMAIPTSTFLVFAGVNHVIEMVRDRNFNPGNTFVCISDFGLPISIWALLLASHSV